MFFFLSILFKKVNLNSLRIFFLARNWKQIWSKYLRWRYNGIISWSQMGNETQPWISTHLPVAFTAMLIRSNQQASVATLWYPPSAGHLIIGRRRINCNLAVFVGQNRTDHIVQLTNNTLDAIRTDSMFYGYVDKNKEKLCFSLFASSNICDLPMFSVFVFFLFCSLVLPLLCLCIYVNWFAIIEFYSDTDSMQ